MTTTFDDALRYMWGHSNCTYSSDEFIDLGLKLIDECYEDALACSSALLLKTYREAKVTKYEKLLIELEAVPGSKVFAISLSDADRKLYFTRRIHGTV